MDKLSMVHIPLNSTSEDKSNKSSKLSPQALKEKLKGLERNRKIRLSKRSSNSLCKHSTPSKSCIKKSSEVQLFSSSNTEKSSDVLSTDDIDDLSELGSGYSSILVNDVSKCRLPNNQESIQSSSSEDKTPSLVSGDEIPEVPDRDINNYNLPNDNCNPESISKTTDSDSIIKRESSENDVTINAQKQTGFETDTDVSGCAEIIISHHNKYENKDGSDDNCSSPLSNKSMNILKNSELEFPSTPESQTFEVGSLQTAYSYLDERFRDMVVFGELISLKVKQLKSQRRNRTSIAEAVEMFQKLFRFNSKCERNFKKFNDNLLRNIKSLKDDYNISIDLPEDASQHIPDNFKHLVKECSVRLDRIQDNYPELFNADKNQIGTDCDIPDEVSTSESDKEIANLTNLNNLKRKRSSSITDSINSPKRSKIKSKSNEEELYNSDNTHVSTVSMRNSDADDIDNNLPVNDMAKKQILANSSNVSTDLESDESNVEKTPKTADIEKEAKEKTSEHSENDNNKQVVNTRIPFSDLCKSDASGTNESKTDKEENYDNDSDHCLSYRNILPSSAKLKIKLDSISSSSDSDTNPIRDLFIKMKKRNEEKKNISSQVFDVKSSDSEGDLGESGKKGRKNIRDILDDDVLDRDTQIANIEERERLQRLTQRNISFSQTSDDIIDNTNDFVLDYDTETKKPLVKVDEHLNKYLKDHQREGIRFMWDSCYESVEMIKKKNHKGQGCILAHCMGLGKTLQVIALAHTVMRNYLCSTKTVLVVCPRSVTVNWREEITRWLQPFPRRQKAVYDFANTPDLSQRTKILTKWHESGGFMLISYDMYRILLKRVDGSKVKNKFMDTLKSTLRDPGPDIVFLDEGHALKNEQTIVRKQLEEIRTRRRVILTGTPLQNNLKEYYWMVHFVKPKLLGTPKEFSNRFANPILNGQHKDSQERDIKIMKKRSHVLHKLLKGTIQRKEVAVLKEYLPQKYEYVLMLTPSPIQERLYNFFLTGFAQKFDCGVKFASARLFADFQALKRVWTHPYALINFLEICLDLQKKQLARVQTSSKYVEKDVSMDMDEIIDDLNPYSQNIKAFLRKTKEPLIPWDWWKKAVSEEEINSIFSSSKLTVMFDIIKECRSTKEKVLVFSSSLNVLNSIEYYLKMITKVTKSNYEGSHPKVGTYRGIWEHTLDYFRFDGQLSSEERQQYCKKFNDLSNVRGRLFLVSTKAGGIGLNMTGANRVIILDVSWNPATDTQSIFRAYRLQQKKTCYVYRLIAMGFMEQKIYERSVTKEAVAGRVVDELQIDRHYSMDHLKELYSLYETPEPKSVPKIPEDSVLANLLPNSKHIYSYHEHDSLLMNLEEEELMPEEQALAWEEFLSEKDFVKNPMAPIGYVDKDGVIMPQSYADQYDRLYPSNVRENYVPSTYGSSLALNPYGLGNLNEISNIYLAPRTEPQQNNIEPRRVLLPISTTINQIITTMAQSTKTYGRPKTTVESCKIVAGAPPIMTIDLTSQPSTSVSFNRNLLSKQPNPTPLNMYKTGENKYLRRLDKSPYARTPPAYIQKKVYVNPFSSRTTNPLIDVVDLTSDIPNLLCDKSSESRLENLPLTSSFNIPVSNEAEISSRQAVSPATAVSTVLAIPNTSKVTNNDTLIVRSDNHTSNVQTNNDILKTSDTSTNLQIDKPSNNVIIPTSNAAASNINEKHNENEIYNNETGELAMHDYCRKNPIFSIGIRKPESINNDYVQNNNQGTTDSGNEFNKKISDDGNTLNKVMESDEIIDLELSQQIEDVQNAKNVNTAGKSVNRETLKKVAGDNVSNIIANEIILNTNDRTENQSISKGVEKSTAFILPQEAEEMIEASLESYLRDEERKQKE